MKNYEVDIRRWHKMLVLALNDEAVEAYGRAPPESQGDYGQLKKHLLKEFHITKETHRRKLDVVKKDQTESWLAGSETYQGSGGKSVTPPEISKIWSGCIG